MRHCHSHSDGDVPIHDANIVLQLGWSISSPIHTDIDEIQDDIDKEYVKQLQNQDASLVPLIN